MSFARTARWFLVRALVGGWVGGLVLAGSGLVPGATDRDRPPNVVLILADDLGAHDLACTGADLHETPQLDQLAREGLRFTQAYAAAPVCSPTRAALLTGQSPARLQITIWSEGARSGPMDRRLVPAESRPDLPHREITLATALQRLGYFTALVGKWHLGDAEHAPETHGFDINIGGTHWGAPFSFFWPYRGRRRAEGEFRYVPHLEFGEPGEYLTDRLTDEALRVIDHAADRQQPFFLYLAHHAPHTPIEAPEADVDHFRRRRRPEFHHQHAGYAAMVRRLDSSVGRVLDRLRQRQLDRQTLVVFTSDNGGYLGRADDGGAAVPVTSNWPLRSGKGTCYEGGLRVPLIVRWPGVTPAHRECAVPVVLTDLFPTLLAAAGGRPAADRPLDGVDLAPLLTEPAAPWPRDALYFHYPHYYFAPPSTPVSALRAGDWKLLEYFEDGHLELYDLRTDPQESHDRAAELPERAAELRQQLHTWRQSVAARLPQPNPNPPAREPSR